MKKIAIVYWSGTGNTEAMAHFIAEGTKENGAEAFLFKATEFTPDMVSEYDAIAFGCPSMGAEELEDTEFLPMFEAVGSALSGKPIALFGSYGWGSGEWMETWKCDCENLGCRLVTDPVIANNAPDDNAAEALKELGAALANV